MMHNAYRKSVTVCVEGGRRFIVTIEFISFLSIEGRIDKVFLQVEKGSFVQLELVPFHTCAENRLVAAIENIAKYTI